MNEKNPRLVFLAAMAVFSAAVIFLLPGIPVKMVFSGVFLVCGFFLLETLGNK